MKILIVLSLLMSTAVFADEFVSPTDPLLSAKKIEHYPENGLMKIHSPQYKYMGKKLNVLSYTTSDKWSTTETICEAFGGRTHTEHLKLYTFWSYLKDGAIYYHKDNVDIKTQTGYYAPIKELVCSTL